MNGRIYEKLGDLFNDIRDIKPLVVNMHGKELQDYKRYFYYDQKFMMWQKDVLWEYIWGDVSYLYVVIKLLKYL